jgi:hypothetical protein
MITLEPILADCRAIYQQSGVTERFWAYVELMTKQRGELLPLGDFSPMGKRQTEVLDTLIAINAEATAADVCQQFAADYPDTERFWRVMLVVVDEPKNGWTQRYLTDFSWRFAANYHANASLDPSNNNSMQKRWISVYLWTTHFRGANREIDAAYVIEQTRLALRRAAYQADHGTPVTLLQMLRQEQCALSYAGTNFAIDADDLHYSASIIASHHWAIDQPTQLAALYGDHAAKSVGYEAIGLSDEAGFAVALSLKS